MSALTSERYGLAAAPGGLSLLQDLLNTVGRRGRPDLFNDPQTEREWYQHAVASWMNDNPGLLAAAPPFLESDVPALRILRDTLRVALMHRDDPERASEWRLDGTGKLHMDGGGKVTLSPAASRSARLWMIDAVLLESFRAQVLGTWPRLKLCANQWCLMAFYDRSKNSSGVWHDVKTCGNEHNLRVSRARRSAARKIERAGAVH
ncbi:CGNR zinc finger domain-containing protein [Herbiconiux sp. CPCC 205763]|uniref:CGNR zinc finger domain-containing protein n=1 Tax=Herbiconiux aconitum TaxID=2970913 RepID=A0ABT2GNE3_9MICO|nr:CGNR zinc finger domain-containing protein [Herbiconiux aconitum]MCS5717734.1 CGNR zinc finger domain-containing protein [Herbiconiux aconitum]